MIDRMLALTARLLSRSVIYMALALILLVVLFTLPSGLSRNVEGLQIVPGATWTASGTDKHIQAHGAGIIKVKDTYYMIGEDKTNGAFFSNINCYSSQNLAEWKFEGILLTRDPKIPELGPNRIVERPKVLWNKRTKHYVMIMHIDNEIYKTAEIGFATSKEVCGKYTWYKSYRPLQHESRDIGVFQDDDDSAYLLSEDRPNGLHIYKLSWDYLVVPEIVHTFPQSIESPAILKRHGLYYMFGSHLTGWTPNDNVYSTAPTLSGPWTPWANFAPKGAATFNSQTTYVLNVGKDLAIYQGDRWLSKTLQRSTYIWLPLQIDGPVVTMANQSAWTIDAKAGTWGPAKEYWIEAENAKLLNGAQVTTCKTCSGGQSVGNIGGAKNGAVVFEDVRFSTGGMKTFQIQYFYGGAEERQVQISISGGPKQKVSFLSVTGQPGISVAHVDVPSGTNSIRIDGVDGRAGPDIDRISIPQ